MTTGDESDFKNRTSYRSHDNPITEGYRADRDAERKAIHDQLIKDKADVAEIFETGAGVRFMRKLFAITCADGPTVAVNAETQEFSINRTFYNEGKRSIWMAIKKDIPAEAYIKLFSGQLEE